MTESERVEIFIVDVEECKCEILKVVCDRRCAKIRTNIYIQE